MIQLHKLDNAWNTWSEEKLGIEWDYGQVFDEWFMYVLLAIGIALLLFI